MAISPGAPAPLPLTGGPLRANGFDASGNFYLGSGSFPPGGALTSGARNFLWGNRAGGFLTTASDNIILGLDAGLLMTTLGGSGSGGPNVYIGYTAAKNTTGNGNVVVGYIAGGAGGLASNDVYAMTAIGESALNRITTSQKDTALGSFALNGLIRGGQMTGLGRAAGTNIAEGTYTVAVGHAAGGFNVVSAENIFLGDGAGYGNKTGQPPRITASQSATTLTVTAFTGGDSPIVVGMVFASTTATGLASNITITALDGTGTGGTGTYSVSPSQTVASRTMIGGISNSNNIHIGQSTGTTGFADSNNIIIGSQVLVTSASNITVIGKGQTAAYISGNLSSLSNVAAINNAAGQTWTAAQVRGGLIVRSGAIAVSDTTPTAADIVAAIPGCEVGSTIWFDVVNNDTGLLTIVAGSGVTLSGTTTIATVFTRRYAARVTNATASSEAVTLYGISTAAN